MFVVGLTGGIGSGKTAASDYFKHLGITVVDADVVAREVVEPGTEALQQIKQHFGARILLANGQLDRAQLRSRVFANPDEKKWLEQLLHPLIFNEMIRQLENASSTYAIYVSPLLIEGGQHQLCQRILVIDVDEESQIQRTIERDTNSREQVQAIMQTQATRDQRLAAADDVINNDGSIDDLKIKIDRLHQTYLDLANAHTH